MGMSAGPWPADVNGDGRADMVFWVAGYGYRVMLSTGSSFATDTPWGANSYAWSVGPWLADVDGNGKADIVYGAGAGYHVLAASSQSPDLVTTVNNGIGGSTTIGYKPSSSWPNTYLPAGLVFPTAATLTTSDGRGTSSTVSYNYSGALWTDVEHAFLGFRLVTAVIDAAGDYTQTYYHQHIGCISKPESTYFRDSAGNIFSSSTMTYTENDVPPYTSLMTTRWDYECNETTTCRRILSQLQYDTYGNVTQVQSYGDYDVSGDERTEVKGYVPNTTAYIVGLPAYQNVYAGLDTTGRLMKQTLYLYDTNTSYTQVPLQGLVSSKQAWNDQTGGYVSASYSYDTYGNLVSETDPLGATTTRTYDSTYHLFPLTTCNALNQCSTKSWDTVLGAKTAETDANGFQATFSFDALGRMLKTTRPDGGFIQYTYVNWGNAGTQYTQESIADGSTDGLWTQKYQDGLGRVWRIVSKGGFTADTVYDQTSSRVWKKSLPYVSGETIRYVVNAYDGAGRLRTVDNPDGTQASTVYGNGTAATYDELGHERVTYRDAWGKTTQIREKNGGNYYYTTYGLDALRRSNRLVGLVGSKAHTIRSRSGSVELHLRRRRAPVVANRCARADAHHDL
jgi:YD repeat-containing protein